MPKPYPLPELPEGWKWHDGSQVTQPGYNATPRLTMEGPVVEGNYTGRSVGAPAVKAAGVVYSAGLKKFSACCGIGHAVHFLYPSDPEQNKLEILLQAIEEQNAVCSRTMNVLTLSRLNSLAPPLIAALEARGWSRAFDFENKVWYRGDPNNNVQLWYKNCTALFDSMPQ